ncbi:acyl-CoA dehydrogenase family protein [Nocardia sp. NPDC052001]|uniref:acyl-CoA dehydrogenase family protein n=1 Tax=Nocardia sp. NPDC052001 TaxID=3154853 RepID=UPI003436B238
MSVDWVRAAETLVREVLDDHAADVDRTGKIPAAHFDALAERGFYGFPLSEGMSPDILIDTAATIISGCLATGFVWAQHLGALRAVAFSPDAALRDRFLPRMLAGTYRCGVSWAAARANPTLFAEPVENGFRLTGSAPFVTGWDYIDAVATAVRVRASGTESVATLLIPIHDTAALTATRLPLTAADASATVALRFTDSFVPDSTLISIKPVDESAPNPLSDWINGALSLGILIRINRYLTTQPIDATPYAAQLASLRTRYATALGNPDQTHVLRAEISQAALTAAAAAVVTTGSRSTLTHTPAEQLMREATFALVCTTRDPIKSTLLEAFTPTVES